MRVELRAPVATAAWDSIVLGMRACGKATVLIGFMGTGKSAVGRALAARMGVPCVDTDELISAKLGLAISEIFARLGEQEFRTEENTILEQLSAEEAMVLVTGGGIILRRRNVELLRSLGWIVGLTADQDTLLKRLGGQADRPLLQTANPLDTIGELLAARTPLYRAAADAEIDTSQLSIDAVVEAVLKKTSGVPALHA